MATSSRETPTQPDALEALAARLAEELSAAWRDGRRATAEEFLARHPELLAAPQAAAQLIYEEVCLREEAGQADAAAAVVARFPQWRAELELLLDCHRLLQRPELAGPDFPEAGTTLGDLRLVQELGRGAKGRVFLAVQPSLAGRPLVVKVTPRDGHEHLALARLQHTHIVPLYHAQDFPERQLRGLCMPYLGGATLAQLLTALRDRPPAERTGADLLQELDRIQRAAPLALPSRSPARDFFQRARYVDAVCILGECLADALQYAHERELVHLDVKPSNVLLAADAQPMLLDFHLARAPLRRGQPVPEWFGGTPDYMAPEQVRTLEAVQQRRPVPEDVGPRADVHALGLVLYEALGGAAPAGGAVPGPLHHHNPQVSRGLSALVHRCLAAAPADRYASAGAVAADLRRHRESRPLRGVREPSGERWRKWRRRRPYAVLLAALAVLAVTAVAAAAGLGGLLWYDTARRAEGALRDGRQQVGQKHFDDAERTLKAGLDAARVLPSGEDLAGQLAAELRRARRARFAHDLHEVAEQVRFRYGGAPLPPAGREQLLRDCRALWDRRGQILDRSQADLGEEEEQVREDLLDLALFWADQQAASPEAREVLDEAEAAFGPTPALVFRRGGAPAPRTAWEHYTLGRSLLAAGRLEEATRELTQSRDLKPDAFWPQFDLGVCLYRQKNFHDAAAAFRTCTALAPRSGECYYNLARAEDEEGRPDLADRDFRRAAALNPALPEPVRRKAP